MLFAQRFQHLWKSESLSTRDGWRRPPSRNAVKLSQGRPGRQGWDPGTVTLTHPIHLTAGRSSPRLRALRGGGLSIPGPFGPPAAETPTDEAHVPAEQPSPEEDPRLPGAYADQGRPARAQAPAPEGAQADRGLGPAPVGRLGQRLRSQDRLHSGAQFQRVFRRGIRVDGQLFGLVAAQNDRGFDRVGLAVGRKLGPAVGRNRARRLLREAFRRHRRQAVPGYDLVLLAKREVLHSSQQEVDREYQERLRRLGKRAAASRRPPAPAHD
jgi:ribonuclease P protein component